MPANNQSIFEKYFLKVLDEQNVAGPGGAFGGDLQGGDGKGGSVGNDDFYARGDARWPKSLFGKVIRRPGIKHKKKKCRSSKKKN